MTTRATHSVLLAGISGLLTTLPLLPFETANAQTNPSGAANEPASSGAVYDRYYRSVKSMQTEHQERLAEISRQRDEAMRTYTEENKRRAQELSVMNRADHETLAGQQLRGAERRSELDRVQSEDKRRREEYAQWRDSTARGIQDDYRAAREQELTRHKAAMDQALAARIANVAQINAGILSPGAAAVITNTEFNGRSEEAPEVGAERSVRGYGQGRKQPETDVTPAAGGGVAGTDSSVTASAGGGVAGTSSVGTGVSLQETTGVGIGEDASAGRGAGTGDAVVGADRSTVNQGQGSKLDRKLPESMRTPAANSPSRTSSGSTSPGTSTDGVVAGPAGGVDTPVRSEGGDSFRYGDGSTVSAYGPGGDLGKVSSKGDIVYADGTTVVHTGEGEITVHRPDGSSVTQTLDESGQWQTESATKPFVAGSGSNDKFVAADDKYYSGSPDGTPGTTASGGTGPRGGSGSSNSSGSGGSSGSGDSNDSDSSSSSSDDNDSGGGSSGGKDSDESGSADGGSGEGGDGGDAESTDDADAEGEGTEYYAENGGGSTGGPSDTVQAIINRVTGQTREIETGVPEPCEESAGLGVTQPGPGGSNNCIPGHLPGVSADNDQQPDAPDAGTSAQAEDARRAGSNDIAGSITQPGLGEQGIPLEDLPSGDPLDQAPVVNPGPQ